ncbi:hypothetical protein Poly24_31980 [Rosistilla carotiformis]|uniref:Uncharacterized protein n=1 Tax=Rosistilla carotiformis TaxID=2528017 RepID=A0A518JVA7_9BACT|nr:hypothetical protein Poly24_31980 [Rosistilla carotiformis]
MATGFGTPNALKLHGAMRHSILNNHLRAWEKPGFAMARLFVRLNFPTRSK